ncbi:MAG: nucleotidyltransferase domain-containing protein [Candidatus Omnitrophica bacterium]|nr:nucleotidyltransferase domain-containing protein [Candidatus Omnitrophota bacterium]MBU4479526.1 nucleotidyltransferase domain-containing protein [Candidatus Omnitrophota bacterium]
MAEERIREAVELIRNFLKDRHITVDKIIVFGSYAKGNYTKDSDLDIAIVSCDFDGKDIFQKAEMLKGLKWSLVENFMLPFDIIPLSLKEWQESSALVVDFVKEGEVLSP